MSTTGSIDGRHGRLRQPRAVALPLSRVPRLPEGWGLVACILALTLILGVLPLGHLLRAALAPGGAFDLAPAVAEISRRASIAATLHSLETASISALGALVLGTTFALIVRLTDVPHKRALAFLFVFSLMVAPQVMALAFLSLAGPASPLLGLLGLTPQPGSSNPLTGRGGIILVMALHHAPLVAITVWAGLRAIPDSLVEAAGMEGASPAQVTWRIILPLLRPHLVAAALAAFVAGIGNFGIPALMGLPVNYLTLPTLIYRRLASYGPAGLSDAATLSILVALIAAIGTVAGALAMRGYAGRVEIDKPLQAYWRLGALRRWVAAGLWIVLTLKVGLPFLALLGEALTPALGVPLTLGTMGLDKFAEVLTRQDMTIRAFRNSLVYSGLAAVGLGAASIVLAYGLARRLGRLRAVIEPLIEIPYALPGVVLAIACILMFLKPLPVIGISIYATPFIILFAYAARFLPLALKSTLAAMAQIEPHHEDAARLEGATTLQLLRHVVAPILLPSAAAGALLVFLIAFNELTVSALLWTSGTETLGVVLFSLKEAGLAGEAAAIAVSASVVVLLAMLALDRLGNRLPEGIVPWRV